MKKLLGWGGVTLLTTALLDPLIYGGLGNPIPWGRDALMAVGGSLCFWLMIRFRDYM
jgi:hypothetical protein